MNRVILDCDPGMDDSVAILLALASKDIKLEAITTLNGNYPADVTAINALKVVELANADVPVAKGMAEPMTRKAPKDPFTHGKDGQAEANLPTPKRELDSRHGVMVIADIIRKYPGEVTIVTTGPMSNVAMALKLYPEIIPMIKGITAISGAFGFNKASFFNATGDTPQSEWNVYVDPEAAKVVYESGIPLNLIGLDIATNFDVDFSDSQIERLEKSSSKAAWFLLNAINFVRGRGFGAYCAVIDAMAVAAVIEPDLLKYEKYHVGIDTRDGLTLGMTVRDGRHHFVWENLPYLALATECNYERFLELLISRVE